VNKLPQTAANGKKFAVTGSGPAALSAAYHLRRLGHQVSLFEPSANMLLPYIAAEQVPVHILNIEIEVIRRTGIEIHISSVIPDATAFDGLIATLGEQPSDTCITPQTKTKQPARLVLEGRRMAERLLAATGVCGQTQEAGKAFNSTYSRFSAAEKQALSAASSQPDKSNCLYCDCDEKTTCRLRRYAGEYGLKNSRYTKNTACAALRRQPINGNMYFEQAKCIRCGLCVYNSDNGFTFKDRGFVMQVVLPEANAANVTEPLAELCPTGAIYLRK
jgi:ferredoxin